MEPSKSKKKWVIGGIILCVAIFVAVGPVLMTRYMRPKTQTMRHHTADFMIKVSGTIQQDGDSVYLKGNNGLYYVLIGEQTSALLENLDKVVTVFGTIYEPREGETIAGNPIRFKIGVVKFDFVALNPSGSK